MKFHLKLFVVLSIAILFFNNEISMGQSKGKPPKMMYADSSRTGKPFSKNPFVIQFKGRYLMYSSVLPVKGSQSREIEITESFDLIHWKNVGFLNIQEPYEKNGISAPCALVIKGKVHVFYFAR
jgi:hypothetical protein